VAATVYSCALAGVMLLVAGSVAGSIGGAELLRVPTPTEFGALVYLAVMVTAVVCVAWFAAMDRLGAARTGLFNGVIPVASLAAVTLAGVGHVTPAQAAGALAVLVGVMLGLTAGGTAQPVAGVGPSDGAPENATRREAVPGIAT
jgi:drug/metabolite transporter (DMT)-like permease